jgi:steroid delta-isomerase-like uncharacterized protein
MIRVAWCEGNHTPQREEESRMSAADNTALVRQYLETLWAEGDPAVAEAFLAPHYQRHLTPHTPPLPREGFRQRLARFRAAFTDLQHTLDDLFAEGDRVAIRVTIRGTHRGVFQGIAPTGTAVTVSLVEILRIAEGTIAESWGGVDLADVLHQLSAVVSVDPDTQ